MKYSTRDRTPMLPRKKNHPALIVSEADLEAALDYLDGFPLLGAAQMPRSWRRTFLLERIDDALNERVPKIGDLFPVGPGLWALIQPFAIDVREYVGDDDQLQVWLLIRPAGTDMKRMLELTTQA